MSTPFHSRIHFVNIFLFFPNTISRDLTVRMFTTAVLLVFVLETETSSGSVSVGANVGISDLFKPSTEYHYVRQSHPYYLDEYQYQYPPLDFNYFHDEDIEESLEPYEEVIELDEIDRQVGSPGVGDPGAGLFGDLTPLLLTSALVVGLR